ncbi:Uncharacterized protein Adt_35577 [Abeliophyllum distichum]|uniref:Retrovirus-related Pol polyprotein from transposon TNT 1-94-like beta-barrel domain-containing protein n=1 Tax=Abeliophyllum distichum TaxID=126358 RepID=A0ABD1QFC6_9LAMI
MSPNPEYSRWISVDRLLMGWMYSSMTSKIVMRVMDCNSSSELWKAINENYGILNRFDEKYMEKRPSDQNHILNAFAYTASPISVEDQAWYADSGASHRVTIDKENVDKAKEYGGKKKMVVGNSTSLQIYHIDSRNFDVKYDKTLVLKTLLHVPRIKKNL